MSKQIFGFTLLFCLVSVTSFSASTIWSYGSNDARVWCVYQTSGQHYCQIKNVDGGLGNGYKSVGSNKNVGVNVGQYPGVQVLIMVKIKQIKFAIKRYKI